MDDQLQVAHTILASLSQDAVLGEPFLRGSLADGGADCYSDIDIGLRPAQLTDTEAVTRVVELLYRRHAIAFHDWARSLLPGAAVVSFFLRDLPVYWNIDVEVVVPDGRRVATRDTVPHDPVAHLLKVWPIALKYALREDDAHYEETVRFVSRYTATPPVEWRDVFEGLETALRAIEADAGRDHTPFLARCWRAYDDADLP